MERASAKPIISRGAVLSPNAKQQCKMKILPQPNQDLHPAIFQMTKGKLQTSCFQSSFAFAAWP